MPTMNVSLTEEMADYVSAELESGDYASAADVVRDALGALKRDREMEQARMRHLREAVGEGLQQAQRGEFSDRSISDIAAAVLAGSR